jgi:hypothetical protein
VSPSVSILSVLVVRVSNKSISILISLRELQKNNETVDLEALLDSGADGLFIDETFARNNDFTLYELPGPLNAYNVDGMLNKKGTITSYVEADLKIGDQIKKTRLHVTGLGKQNVILGFPWLKDEKPTVDWKSGEIQWKERERRNLGQRAIELTRARLAKQTVSTLSVEQKKYSPATVEDAEEKEEDQSLNPLPS